jgi:hypothetical protein
VSVSVIDDTPPTWTSLNNKTCYVNATCNHQVTATDSSGISAYILNETNIFNINPTTGAITNITALSSIAIYYLNISVNDTQNNLNSGVIWINITARPVIPNGTGSALCRYRKFGYWNNKLPFFSEPNCI